MQFLIGADQAVDERYDLLECNLFQEDARGFFLVHRIGQPAGRFGCYPHETAGRHAGFFRGPLDQPGRLGVQAFVSCCYLRPLLQRLDLFGAPEACFKIRPCPQSRLAPIRHVPAALDGDYAQQHYQDGGKYRHAARHGRRPPV